MTDTFEFTLNNPLTEEQWDMIADVDFDRTDRVWFHTKHCKEVEFVKVIRCKDCKHYWESAGMCTKAEFPINNSIEPNDYCSRAERKTE